MKYDTALFISSLLFERLSYGKWQQMRHNGCLFGSPLLLKGFLVSAAPTCSRWVLPSQVLQEVARLGRHVRRHVDADGRFLRLVVFFK